MDEKRTFHLINDHVRRNAIDAVREADAMAIVTVSPRKRSLEQNAKLHALLTDLARSPLEWAGKRRTVDEWKMLMVSAHAVATKEPGEVIPGLEGEFVAIRESTAQMSVGRASSLIEYIVAFCVERGVDLHETRRGGFLDPGASSSNPGHGGASPIAPLNARGRELSSSARSRAYLERMT